MVCGKCQFHITSMAPTATGPQRSLPPSSRLRDILEGYQHYISQVPLQLGVAIRLVYGHRHMSRSDESSFLGMILKVIS